MAAAIGEQGITPRHPEEAAAPQGQEQEMTDAAPEGEERTEAAQVGKEEAPAGETSKQPPGATEDPAALLADMAALLNSPAMVETLQRMVAEATAKVQACKATKVMDLE